MAICKLEGCGRQAAYNHPNEKSGVYCGLHKYPGMLDLRHPRCITGCGKVAYYNKPGANKQLYCPKHKEEGMVNPQLSLKNK